MKKRKKKAKESLRRKKNVYGQDKNDCLSCDISRERVNYVWNKVVCGVKYLTKNPEGYPLRKKLKKGDVLSLFLGSRVVQKPKSLSDIPSGYCLIVLIRNPQFDRDHLIFVDNEYILSYCGQGIYFIVEEDWIHLCLMHECALW